ncbi:MAG: neutral/alkaline non-lysosomal ceramidase N-terminal domain-containing protein [Thermoguttaceae bacterium]|nr:neutral/alkaline non-lysosomal ceramidase N-terminal domain-containing protein [Thermoguttaceae bacterium]MDW8036991.1 neutral/alkaline non-lysosomal ceramidase N-terminal domain-containing protein [Thermoguttaceae bacterium]
MARRKLWLGVGLMLVGLMGIRAQAAEEALEWKVGLARVNITPEGPIWMAGYAARNKPSEGVLLDLWAKALLLEDKAGHQGLILSVDVIGFNKQVWDAVVERVGQKTGLKREQILLAPSHTHTGPVISLGEETIYIMPEEKQKIVYQYTGKLIGQLADIAARALADRKPARLSWGWGVVHFPMNRREFTPRGVILGVNPSGYADRRVPVLRAEDAEGKLQAVVFGCACHCTTLTGQHYVISGDYAGFAQEHIEKHYPGVQAMFIAGCAGDTNPYPRGEIEHARKHGADLGAEVCRVLQGKLQPVRGPLCTLLEYAEAPLQPVPPQEELEKLAKGPAHLAHNAKRMLAALKEGKPLPTKFLVPIALWQFGEDLTLVGISGEVLGGYVLRVEKAIGPLNLWVAGYINEVFGYLPTAAAIAEGGYETRGLYTEQAGFFAPQVEELVVAKIRQLAEKAGRKLPNP